MEPFKVVVQDSQHLVFYPSFMFSDFKYGRVIFTDEMGNQ